LKALQGGQLNFSKPIGIKKPAKGFLSCSFIIQPSSFTHKTLLRWFFLPEGFGMVAEENIAIPSKSTAQRPITSSPGHRSQ